LNWVRRVRLAFALLVVGGAGIAAAFAATTAPGSSSTRAAVATTVVVRGTDSAVSVSPKRFAKGTVTFKITNNGRRIHTFVVAGKRTKVKPHHTATARIAFRSAGKFTYTWTGGTKAITGKLTVTGGGGGGGGSTTTHTTSTTATSTTTTTTTTSTSTTTTTTPPPTSCTNPSTTVQVGMFEYRFELSQATIPAGCIQFVITNKGIEQHNFDIAGVKAGAILAPGTTETWAVQLSAKTYTYVCDVPFHVDRGMTGSFTVTP